MYLHFFFLLFSSGVSGCFLPLKETPQRKLQNKTTYPIIDEMLCLLNAEKETIKEKFPRLPHIKNESCAHYNTKTFLDQLKRIQTFKCMQIVEKDMEELEKNCSILQKSSPNVRYCEASAKTNFSLFKESLEEFLKWINGEEDCKIMARSKSGLYLDGKCNCSNPWKYRKGWL